MKGIINSHSALTAYRRQTAVDPVAAPESPAKEQGAPSDASSAAARVSISARAKAMAQGDGPIDSGKIENLKQAIRAGTLKLDSQLIAQRMVDQGE